MPRPKLPTEVVDLVVELLLGGWKPQDIVARWPGSKFNRGNDCLSCPSLGTIQRIAREAGLSAPRGGSRINSGGARPGAGRKPTGPGTGTKHETHAKWSRHRAEVRRLREEGHSLRVIAGLVGLRSPQQVANLLSDDPKT